MEKGLTENELRKRLGIPDGVPQVLIFGESSHWDPNWLCTSHEYYRIRVKRIIDRVIKDLRKEPRRVFSLEAIFFLKMYWEREPEKQDTIRALVNSGQLRLIGTGYTSPDTTLPETEAIFRDYLYGQTWLRENGMYTEPKIAYLPDDFGCSPALPSILQELGLEYVSIARIDGQFFIGTDYRSPKNYPLAGSNAELLSHTLKSIDFVWQSRDGAKVLCHLNPYGYGQGDYLTFKGLGRWMGITGGVPSRSDEFIAKRIKQFAAQLAPVSKTPYLFCPIGFDFNSPIKDLLYLLDRYNTKHSGHTGIYVINGSLEDYCTLVSYHSEKIPQLAIDPNPYYMGFYTSRGALKRQCVEAAQRLVSIEKRLVGSENTHTHQLTDRIRSVWEKIAVTNHHDFITGTAPNRVYEKEQRPWMDDIFTAIGELSEGIAAPVKCSSAGNEYSDARPTRMPQWDLRSGTLKIESQVYSVVFEERAGGCMTTLTDTRLGKSLLKGLGNDLIVYEDSGGLWRMGHEFRGGTFKEVERASHSQASLSVREHARGLEVTITSQAHQKPITRKVWIENDSDIIWMSIEGIAGDYRTITCSFETLVRPEELIMDVPGGIAQRPLHKLYDPTFWPAKSFMHCVDTQSDRGFALYADRPFAVNADEGGAVKLICIRNAPLERAFGFLPLLAFPAWGRQSHQQTIDYAIIFTESRDWLSNRLHLRCEEALRPSWKEISRWRVNVDAPSFATTDQEHVVVTALKHADCGNGVIARLYRFDESVGKVTLQLRDTKIRKAVRCTAMEKDIEELDVKDGAATVPMRSDFATVRILL